MMPSTPSSTMRSARVRSFTVQVDTFRLRRRARRISAGVTRVWRGISQVQPSATARRVGCW